MQIGQSALLRLSAFNQRTTPEINGTVTRISADTTTDQRTGQSYYTIRIAMPPEEVAKLGDIKFIPGMPVEAFVQTGERTMLSYLSKPLHDQLMRAVPGEVEVGTSSACIRSIWHDLAKTYGAAVRHCDGPCPLALLVALLVLRIADPAPIEELRLRTFDIFQMSEAA